MRRRFLEDLRLRNYAQSTIDLYVSHVARYARFFGHSPEKLGPEDARRYQLYLLEKKIGWSTYNQAVYGLLFRAVRETLLELAATPKHLGARISNDRIESIREGRVTFRYKDYARGGA